MNTYRSRNAMITAADRAKALARERQQRFRLRHKAAPQDLFCGICLSRFTPARKGQRTCTRACSFAAQGYRKRVKRFHRPEDERRMRAILSDLAQTRRLDDLIAAGKATRQDVDAYLQQQRQQQERARLTIEQHQSRDRDQHGAIADTYSTAADFYHRPIEGKDEAVSGADLLASNVRYGVFAGDLLGLTAEQSDHFWAVLQRFGAFAADSALPEGAMKRRRIRDTAYDSMMEERAALAGERIRALRAERGQAL
jgi:hypothetical protein